MLYGFVSAVSSGGSKSKKTESHVLTLSPSLPHYHFISGDDNAVHALNFLGDETFITTERNLKLDPQKLETQTLSITANEHTGN